MAQISTDIPQLKFNKMSTAKYNELKEAGQLVDNEFYITPDEETTSISLPLLTPKWYDHRVEDISWVDSSTFSWLSNEQYEAVYNELLSEYNIIENEFLAGNYSHVIEENGLSYFLTPKGYKITNIAWHDKVDEIYTNLGIAWYYILDKDNTRFKLPRVANPSLFEKYISAPVVGNGMTLGFTDGTTNAGLRSVSTGITTGVLAATVRAYGSTLGITDVDGPVMGANNTAGLTTDPEKSGVIADLSNATKYAPQGYLYFYVGNYTKSAIEQTAGLNTELFNQKADVDLNNVTNAGKETIVSLMFPDYSTQIALEASSEVEKTYTASTNGWFGYNFLTKGSNSNPSYVKVNDVTVIFVKAAGQTYFDYVSGLIPVGQGDVIKYFCTEPSVEYQTFNFYSNRNI